MLPICSLVEIVLFRHQLVCDLSYQLHGIRESSLLCAIHIYWLRAHIDSYYIWWAFPQLAYTKKHATSRFERNFALNTSFWRLLGVGDIYSSMPNTHSFLVDSFQFIVRNSWAFVPTHLSLRSLKVYCTPTGKKDFWRGHGANVGPNGFFVAVAHLLISVQSLLTVTQLYLWVS